MLLGNWSKTKTILVLILIVGLLLYFLTNSVYIYLYEDLGFTNYAGFIFAIPIVFIGWSTVVFSTKFKGLTKRLLSGIVTLVFQIFLFFLITMVFITFDAFVKFVTPEFVKDETQLTTDVIERFHKKYEIRMINQTEVLHSSYYRIGEEFGFDLIIRSTNQDIEQYKPMGSKFVLLSDNVDDTPFRFGNKQFLCNSSEKQRETQISNADAKRIICDSTTFPRDTMIAEKWVRSDWTITSVYFPAAGIVWITEIEW